MSGAIETFCVDLRAALVTILQAQQAATPTILRRVYASKPGTFGEVPLAYVGDPVETEQWDAGTWTRFLDASIVLVDAYTTNEQTTDRLDQLQDALVNRIVLAPQAAGAAGTILEIASVTPTDIELVNKDGTSTFYRARIVDFGNQKTFRSGGRN